MDVQRVQQLSDMLMVLAEKAKDDGNHDVVLDIYRNIQSKPGVRTSEFYVSVLCTLAGLGMQAWPGHESLGVILTLTSAALFTVSRTVVKVSGQA